MTLNQYRQQAISLREQGMTYKQIVEQLPELSLDWCKRNLKDVKHTGNMDACIQELIDKSCVPEGMTIFQANGIILRHFPELKKEDEKRYIREKAKKANPKCLFRAGWVSVEEPNKSFQTLCALAIDLADILDDYAEQYVQRYPDADKRDVSTELHALIRPFKSRNFESLATRLGRNEALAELLEDRKDNN